MEGSKEEKSALPKDQMTLECNLSCRLSLATRSMSFVTRHATFTKKCCDLPSSMLLGVVSHFKKEEAGNMRQ